MTKKEFLVQYRGTIDLLIRRMNEVIEQDISYVYVAHCAETGLYKIGMSGQPLTRIKQLAGDSAFEITLTSVFRVYTSFALGFEKLLHKTFSHRRTHGEWFKLNEVELTWIGKNAFPFCINFTTCGEIAEPRSVFEDFKND